MPKVRLRGARSSTSLVETGYPWLRRCPTHALQHPQVGDRCTMTFGFAPGAALVHRGSPSPIISAPNSIARRRTPMAPSSGCRM
jgi:hypothetical protein